MDNKADVIVIGAGIVGLSTAYYLALEGKSVIVLEKSNGDDSCSYGNAGYIAPSHIIPLSSPGIISKGLRWMLNPESPFYIKPRLSLPLAQWGINFMRKATNEHVNNSKKLLADLCVVSQELHHTFAEKENLKVQKRGVMMHCLTDTALHHEKELAKMTNDLGIKATVHDIEEMNTIDPKVKHAGKGAVYFPGDSFMNPREFMVGIKKALTGLGVEIKYNQAVTGFSYSGTKIETIQTATEEFSGDEVVLAAGAFTPSIAKLMGKRILIEAGKGYSVDYYEKSLVPEISYILVEARAAITPLGDFVRVAGTMELAGIDQSVNPRRVAGFLKSVSAYLPDFEYKNMQNLPVWAGLRPCSPDGLPYVGRDSKYNNLIVAAGHAMLGFTLGPVTGKLVSEIIDERPTSVNIEQLSVNRF